LRRFPRKHFPAAKQSTIHTMRLADQQTQWREIRKTMKSIIAKHEALTEAQLTSITDNLNTLNPTLDFLVGLTPEESQRFMKMGNKSRSFVGRIPSCNVKQ